MIDEIATEIEIQDVGSVDLCGQCDEPCDHCGILCEQDDASGSLMHCTCGCEYVNPDL